MIERTRAFLSERQLIRYGISSGRCGIMPFIQPSAMAPRTSMPDSLISQLSWNRIPLSIGSSIGKTSSRNTLARTSKAAAEHFPVKFINFFYVENKENLYSVISVKLSVNTVKLL